MRRPAKLLSVADIAELHGVHPDTARLWLDRLDEKTDGRVYIRIGKRKFTSLPALRAADRRLVDDEPPPIELLHELQARDKETRRAVNSLAARVRRLEARLSSDRSAPKGTE
jgi:hypothetical protein